MCGIAAIVNFRRNIGNDIERITKMYKSLIHGNVDEQGILCNENVLLAHTRISIMEDVHSFCPMKWNYKGISYSIVYNGMIYNYKLIRNELIQLGHTFDSNGVDEVILHAYIEWGEQCLERFNGVFAFIISYNDEVFVARDPFGVKPLYYCQKNDGEWLFASEIKAILAEGSLRPVLTKKSFASMISLGPSLENGTTLYKNIYQLKAGHFLKIKRFNYKVIEYHTIKCYKHIETLEDTIYHVHNLLDNCIKNQCISNVGIAGMLSGGIDSSIICSVASQNNTLKTYSLDLENNAQYFDSNNYQPTLDYEYAQNMANYIKSDHQFISVSPFEIVNSLEEAMIARDMPGMADIDSSLLVFCREISKENKVILSGECADEVFGGYPWFYKEEFYERDTFPWLNYLPNKIELVNDHFKNLDFYGIRKNAYNKECDKVPYLEGDSVEDRISKKMTFLSIYNFMQTLLMRMDAMASLCGIEGRVPFADKDLIDYVFNIPWSMKYYNNQEKKLLREAFENELPLSILERKKSPFPKTYDPVYTELVCTLLENELNTNELMSYYFDYKLIKELIESRGDTFKLPWFGQLMKGPQLIAYLYQFSRWTRKYSIIPE